MCKPTLGFGSKLPILINGPCSPAESLRRDDASVNRERGQVAVVYHVPGLYLAARDNGLAGGVSGTTSVGRPELKMTASADH